MRQDKLSLDQHIFLGLQLKDIHDRIWCINQVLFRYYKFTYIAHSSDSLLYAILKLKSELENIAAHELLSTVNNPDPRIPPTITLTEALERVNDLYYGESIPRTSIIKEFQTSFTDMLFD